MIQLLKFLQTKMNTKYSIVATDIMLMDAFKDGERYLSFHKDRDMAAAMLMGLCGWDLE